MTLASRAAAYFGLEREPRVDVPLGDGMYAIVAERGDGPCCALAVYKERSAPGEPDGFYVWLTERQRGALASALAAAR